MNEELKTLNDMRPYWFANQVKSQKTRMAMFDDLRAEAIKWVKEIENEESIIHGWKKMGCLPWIVEFFNLTGEDLK